MDPYRHTLYRYSTGNGFSPTINPPEESGDVASYKMEPLQATLMRPEFSVDIKREADRISMQVEAGMQQVKVLGYNAKAGKKLRHLKVRLEVIKHLMTTYPIRYIKQEDLEKIYDQYAKNSPGMDALIQKVVNQNKGATGIQDFIGTAMKVRKGYPLFDKFGRKLSPEDKKKFENKGLSGLGESLRGVGGLRMIGLLLTAAVLIKAFSKS